jgi:endonuclease/exonuclease/phosphatase family metal-dependent hydrolase
LLTNLPIAATQHWALFTPPGPYDGSEPSEPRSAVMAKLELAGRYFWAGSTHLPRSDPRARTAAARRLLELAERLDTRWIVCGDFNATPADCLGDHHALTIAPNPPRPTHPARQPDEPIDYVIASPGTSTEAQVLPTAGSDHLPVLAIAHLGLQGTDPAAGTRLRACQYRDPQMDRQ